MASTLKMRSENTVQKRKTGASARVRVEEDIIHHFNKVFPQKKVSMPRRWLPRTAEVVTGSVECGSVDLQAKKEALKRFGEDVELRRYNTLNGFRAMLDEEEAMRAQAVHVNFIKAAIKHRRKASQKRAKKRNWKNLRTIINTKNKRKTANQTLGQKM